MILVNLAKIRGRGWWTRKCKKSLVSVESSLAVILSCKRRYKFWLIVDNSPFRLWRVSICSCIYSVHEVKGDEKGERYKPIESSSYPLRLCSESASFSAPSHFIAKALRKNAFFTDFIVFFLRFRLYFVFKRCWNSSFDGGAGGKIPTFAPLSARRHLVNSFLFCLDNLVLLARYE